MQPQQRAILVSLLQMAYADGQVVDPERELLARMLSELGAVPKELEETEAALLAQDMPHLEDLLSAGPQRAEVLKQLIRMSFCDGVVSFTEFAYLATMARRLGFTKTELEGLRDEVIQELGQTPEEV